ncbi:MAG: hypothetical protein QXP18_03885 [Sulfolobales archaeon]
MSAVVSIRVPRELKEKMDELKRIINWNEEIRKCIEIKVKEAEQPEAIDRLEELIKELGQTRKGTAAAYVRDDRDSN